MVEKFKFSHSLKLVENTLELMKQSIVIELCEHVAFYGLANSSIIQFIVLPQNDSIKNKIHVIILYHIFLLHTRSLKYGWHF